MKLDRTNQTILTERPRDGRPGNRGLAEKVRRSVELPVRP